MFKYEESNDLVLKWWFVYVFKNYIFVTEL